MTFAETLIAAFNLVVLLLATYHLATRWDGWVRSLQG
jgi:hypothetical protein